MNKNLNIVVLDRTTEWKKNDTETIMLKDMHTHHIIRAMQFVYRRKEINKDLSDKIPAVFQDEFLKLHNGKSCEEWITIFEHELNYRAKEINAQKKSELESQLQDLETNKQKIERLKKELAKYDI